MNCTQCGGQLGIGQEGSFLFCGFCGHQTQTPRTQDDHGVVVLDLLTGSDCCRCGKALQAGLVETVAVEFCTSCHGTLINDDAFASLLQHLRGTYQGSEARPQRFDPREMDILCSCPHCNRTMDTHPYNGPGNVVIDSCFRCGVIWLDGCELDRLVASPGRRSLRR